MNIYRVASSLGPRYMMPTHFEDLADAEAFLTLHHRHLKGFPGVDTVRIEVQLTPSNGWTPHLEGEA